jgi:hypothetical protein
MGRAPDLESANHILKAASQHKRERGEGCPQPSMNFRTTFSCQLTVLIGLSWRFLTAVSPSLSAIGHAPDKFAGLGRLTQARDEALNNCDAGTLRCAKMCHNGRFCQLVKVPELSGDQLFPYLFAGGTPIA